MAVEKETDAPLELATEKNVNSDFIVGHDIPTKGYSEVNDGSVSDSVTAGDMSDEAWVDPRVKDYVVPLVAKTVHLDNDPT